MTGSRGPVASVQEPAIPSSQPVQVRPSRDALEAARLKAAKSDDPDTVYEVNVSQWGHDDNRYVRGQLLMASDVPAGYDFAAAKRNETVIPSTVSAAEYRKMQKESTETALEREGLK